MRNYFEILLTKRSMALAQDVTHNSSVTHCHNNTIAHIQKISSSTNSSGRFTVTYVIAACTSSWSDAFVEAQLGEGFLDAEGGESTCALLHPTLTNDARQHAQALQQQQQ